VVAWSLVSLTKRLQSCAAKAELVFDGVAISDTSALVRRPLDARVGRPFGRHFIA
jgi:hypothetical protein